jgi:hypothetical protein
MATRAKKAPSKEKELVGWNPNDLVDKAGQLPSFYLEWREPGKKKGEKVPPQRKKKRRLLSIPNRSMRALHKLFGTHLEAAIDLMGDDNEGSDNYTLRRLPSATGCVRGSNPYKNAAQHFKDGERYLVSFDFSNAYPSVDLRRLTMLLVYIFRYEMYGGDYNVRTFGRNPLAQYAVETDPMFEQWHSFVMMAFGGIHGQGLTVGGPLSPTLLNLYCEVYLDSRIRQYLEKLVDRRDPETEILYTRYVDDLVFSSRKLIYFGKRRELRRMIAEAGFEVNHRKSKIVDTDHGTVFITKVGLENRDGKHVLVFPKKKRCRLEGLIQTHLCANFHKDEPEMVAGLIAEFLHYYKLVTADPDDETKRLPASRSDQRTFERCKEFEKAFAPYLKELQYAREDRKEEKEEERTREKNLKRVLKARARHSRT